MSLIDTINQHSIESINPIIFLSTPGPVENTLPETNIAPENRPSQLSGAMLVSGRVNREPMGPKKNIEVIRRLSKE